MGSLHNHLSTDKLMVHDQSKSTIDNIIEDGQKVGENQTIMIREQLNVPKVEVSF